uniref:Uncharacterized protein n=1 Tax=Laticauda laticaudata TaxID=8630 RepID=A0A8C5SI41_LATLA
MPSLLGGGEGGAEPGREAIACLIVAVAALPLLSARDTRVARPSRTEEEQPDTKGETEKETNTPKKKESKVSMSKNSKLLSTSAKRIQKELADITLDPPPNCRYPFFFKKTATDSCSNFLFLFNHLLSGQGWSLTMTICLCFVWIVLEKLRFASFM